MNIPEKQSILALTELPLTLATQDQATPETSMGGENQKHLTNLVHLTYYQL